MAKTSKSITCPFRITILYSIMTVFNLGMVWILIHLEYHLDIIFLYTIK